MTIWDSELHVGRESAVARVNQARSARSGFYSVIVWNHRVNGFSRKCMRNMSAEAKPLVEKPRRLFARRAPVYFSLLCSGKCNRRASLGRVSWDRRRIRSELRYPDKRRSVFTTQSRIDRKSQRCQATAQFAPLLRTLSPFALSTIVKNQDRGDHSPQAPRVIIVVYAAPRGLACICRPRSVEGHLIPDMGVHMREMSHLCYYVFC
ncbi:hypothetical protein ALC62_07265 [Cyphomyrmex costatus]|uniref:Uncharacterized protein n=1 Tax=Cyphomyrmex costatus TaxID=456900 RepID=A0A195CNB1_9HYME|nr:hypothetical protein ALC62_07265 [Cyphomyrmex costatus]